MQEALTPITIPAYRYAVIDIQPLQTVRTYSTSRKAHNAADRMDLAYGAVRYIVRCVA